VVEVRLFGGLSVAVDGRSVELPADARARELLARLALATGPQPRSALAGRLRPDVPEESARKTLRNALYELRRALGPGGRDAIVVEGDRIGLGDTVRVDVRAFRRHVAEGDLATAVEAARGELLDGFDGDWALRARDEHAAELAELLGTLAARAEATGDVPVAVAWARRRLDVEPLAEGAHRELIRLLALGGDRSAALAAARSMNERLRAQLGIAPSAATRALVEDVRGGRLAPGPPAATDAAPVAPAPPPALTAVRRPEGREPALARLEQAWADAAAGALRFALIAGEPGIGKSTLAGELARRAHAGGGAVLLGRCDEDSLVPFQPWVEALERLLEALPPAEADHWLTAHDGALARLLPARGPSLAPSEGARERYLAFELVRGLLNEAAVRWPILLVLDDVHWADADSLALLRHLVRSAPEARLLTVLCTRPAEAGPAVTQTIAELRRAGPLAHVELAGLDEEAVAALVARRTGADDREAARRYRARSGGNPFFLDELLREAQEFGGEVAAPPAGVRDVIARRLTRLAEPTRRTLEAAAVCGVAFDATTLARVDGRPVVEVLEALDGAIETALVTATDRPGRCAFAHALVGEAIVHLLPASRRTQLHLQLAGELAERHAAGEVGAGEVVRHLRGAGPLADGDQVASWELVAAREATAALAHAEAAAHYEAALALRAQDPARGELLRALGDAHDRAGRRERARAAFAAAAASARAAHDPALLAQAALGHGGIPVVIAAADRETVQLLEEALAATPAGAAATSARLLARLSVEHYYADPDRARELAARAVEQARGADDAAALAAALNAQRVALWSPQAADERLAAAGEMIAAAEAAGDPEALLQGRNWRVVDLLELGRLADAAAEVDAYAALAEDLGLPHFGWYVPLWRATLATLAGRWTEARELSLSALALGQQADDANAPLFVGIQRNHSLHVQQRIGETNRARLVEGSAGSPASAGWLAYVALMDAETGATNDARRLVAQLVRGGEGSAGADALARDANWHCGCVLAEAAVLVGDRTAGAALYARLEPLARLFPVIARAIGCLGSAEYHVGRLAGLLGRPDEETARLRRAVAENDRVGAPPHAAAALARLGEALARGGQRDEARQVLQQASARADALAMPALAAEVARLLDATAA
jgi:DNA-binding SARP family transcriptional activator/tetratricopeptide (TPR) repeat protein